jgi:hypothetical protein
MRQVRASGPESADLHVIDATVDSGHAAEGIQEDAAPATFPWPRAAASPDRGRRGDGAIDQPVERRLL